MRFLVFLVFCCSSLGLAQQGLIDRFHPLPNAKRIAVRACSENLNGLVCPHGRVLVRNTADGDRQIRLDLFGKQFPIRFEITPFQVSGAWNTDLNMDGKADLILKLCWCGNGIMFDANITIFALSSKEGYRLNAIDTMSFDPSALVYWRGKPVVLHTALVGSNSSRTGRRHNYWVFHPLAVQGARLAAIHAPFWIQFTFNENHRQTNKLTRAEKTRAILEEKLQIFEPLL